MDYKEAYQLRAEEIAWERYNCEFYHLTPATQEKVYADAIADCAEQWASYTDARRKAEREQP